MKTSSLTNKFVVLAVVVALTPLTAMAARESGWIKDGKTGCELFLPRPDHKDTVIQWTGACQNGKAEGHGQVAFVREGREVWINDYGSGSGFSFSQGKEVVTLDRLKVETACTKQNKATLRKGVVHVSPNYPHSAAAIYGLVVEKLFSECPSEQATWFYPAKVNVELVASGRVVASSWANVTKFGGQLNVQWTQSTYKDERDARFAAINVEIDKALRDRQADLQQKAAQQQREAANLKAAAEKSAKDAKAQGLADRYGVKDGWFPWNEVRANIYAHEGKVYLMMHPFEQMLSRDTAQFGDGFLKAPVIVTGVPGTAFTQKRMVVLAVKVLDPEVQKGAGGTPKAPMLRVKYLGHEFCATSDCDDFGSVRVTQGK